MLRRWEILTKVYLRSFTHFIRMDSFFLPQFLSNGQIIHSACTPCFFYLAESPGICCRSFKQLENRWQLLPFIPVACVVIDCGVWPARRFRAPRADGCCKILLRSGAMLCAKPPSEPHAAIDQCLPSQANWLQHQ
jgi:hypothetical protein